MINFPLKIIQLSLYDPLIFATIKKYEMYNADLDTNVDAYMANDNYKHTLEDLIVVLAKQKQELQDRVIKLSLYQARGLQND